MPSIKRTIYIGNPAYLKIDTNRLIIENRQSGDSSIIPIDDIGIIELDNPQVLINNYCLSELCNKNIVVNVCGADHHPAGYLMPLEGNFIQAKRQKEQISASIPLKKNLWMQLIKAKISNQAALLKSLGKNAIFLKNLIEKVRSGDPSNKEGQASRHYWKELFGKDFKRERYGEYPNNLLNYAYSIVRAVVARAVVSTGLHPSIGIFHKNQYNAFCLADDLMEPFRPISDSLVMELYLNNQFEQDLNKEIKAALLNVSYIDCTLDGKTTPLSLAAAATCSSLAKCFEGETKEILCPKIKE